MSHSSILLPLPHGTPESLSGTSDARPTRSPVTKPPRKQVSKACQNCRLRRVRCDDGRPCRPCRQKGLGCNRRGAHNDEARTLPQALREIERLRQRVSELEAELERERQARGHEELIPTLTNPSSSSSITPEPTTSATLPYMGDIESRPSKTPGGASPNLIWEGISTATARSEQTSYYGPSSAFYFMGRIGSHLSNSLQQYVNTKSMQPRGMNKTLTSPTSPDDTSTRHKPCMSRTQEEYFLNLFWESYSAHVPIVAEDEFREHYDSLWRTSEAYRKPSALVDIVLALCMQYGWAFLLQNVDPEQRKDYDDASIAGRLYYRRCQHLLASQLESPSIATLQCHLFSVTYLCCASFQNMAHTTLAIAIRTAQILRLHLEPPKSMPPAERELRKRLWAMTYVTEAKTGMKLGRPICVQPNQVSVSMFSDSIEAASANGSSLRAHDGVTRLTYALQQAKFTELSVDIYNKLYDKFAQVLKNGEHGSFYKDPQRLESCAEYLTTLTASLKDWINQVPNGIKLQRLNAGTPLSPSRAPILIDTTAPTWLQRHRIYLELIYHTMSSNLHRPFITFTSSQHPLTERHALTCASHAIAHTSIMHHALRETDLLNGWQEFFLWQWNVTINLVGFVLAYPVHHATGRARAAIDMAIEIFEVFGSNFAVAASAAAVTRELVGKADLLVARLKDGINSTACVKTLESTELGDGIFPTDNTNPGESLDLGPQDGSNFSEFMDWALTVDSFNSFEALFADANARTDWWGVSS